MVKTKASMALLLQLLPLLVLYITFSTGQLLTQQYQSTCSPDDFYLKRYPKLGFHAFEPVTKYGNNITREQDCFKYCRKHNCTIIFVWSRATGLKCILYHTLNVDIFTASGRITAHQNHIAFYARTSCSPVHPNKQLVPVIYEKAASCSDIIEAGGSYRSGIYQVGNAYRPINDRYKFILCDMEESGGGWTVIQNNEPMDGRSLWTSFLRYGNGFGNLRNVFWAGNKYIHDWTKNNDTELLIKLVADNGDTYKAFFRTFYIGNETEGYPLTIGEYSVADSTLAGDSDLIQSSFAFHNGQRFSTPIEDVEDDERCARESQGGWWFGTYPNCTRVFLNAKHETDICLDPLNAYKAIYWTHTTPTCYTKSTMMIRRRLKPIDI